MLDPVVPAAPFLRAMPKTDLHLHLDGSLRLATLIELARDHGVTLPSHDEAGLRALVYKPHYASLAEYLHGFKYTCAVLRTPEALERVAYELAWDNFSEGVRYIEPRFAPQLCASDGVSLEEILRAVDNGLARAAREINARDTIQHGEEPPFLYGIIGCAMRKFDERFSPYYARFVSCHRFAPAADLYPLASMELVRALVDIRDRCGVPIVGFDIAGEECGYPADAHAAAYAFAHRHFLHKTAHAGEAYGAESIFQAITECFVDRIGHGTHLFHHEYLENIPECARAAYIDRLVEFIAGRRIAMEVCLTSNLQTIPQIGALAQHPIAKMLAHQLSVCVCTDNRLVSNTTVTDEYAKLLGAFPQTAEHLKRIVLYGFKRSFFPGTYAQKSAYVRQVAQYYEALEAHK